MVKNINELNALSDYNEPKIVDFKSNGAKFETSKSVDLTLFANGISLYSGPFRSFHDSLTKKFCIDIMDGYFPSELQEKYPDGVPFNLFDKRDVVFKEERNSVFKSKGYRLGSGRALPGIVKESSNITSLDSSCENQAQSSLSKKVIETQLAGET